MSCTQWNDEWVASLYGELEEVARASLEWHLRDCADCRVTLEELGEASRLVRESAPPVPATPTVVVLRVGSPRRPRWAVAAVAAAAAGIMLAAGLFAFGTREAWLPSWSAHGPAVEDSAAVSAAAAEIVALRERVAELEREARERTLEAEATVTRADLDRELRALTQHQDDQRAADMSYVLRTMTASEQRMDRNAQALTYLALRESPWVAEH